MVLVDTEASLQDITYRSRWMKFKLSLGALWWRITHQTRDESFTVESRGATLGPGVERVPRRKEQEAARLWAA
jgi:hypothetical protein